jgi:hypothetical protein
VRFAVEPWALEYGAPSGDDLDPSRAQIDAEVEHPASRWRPLLPAAARAEAIAFVDGVRRIDAQVWVSGAEGAPRLGLCASYAAGVVRCTSQANVERIEVRRELLCGAGDLEPIHARHATYEPQTRPGDTAEILQAALQHRMRELEVAVTTSTDGGELLVVDGPLRERQHLPHAVGFVKTHQVAYLPAELGAVVASLAPGERTPLFAMTTSWSRLSWYVRLPGVNGGGHPGWVGGGHPWSGIVRAEASADLTIRQARELADLVTATLPAYASAAHKDPRAPQNLYPIGGLERVLRRYLGTRCCCSGRCRQRRGWSRCPEVPA